MNRGRTHVVTGTGGTGQVCRDTERHQSLRAGRQKNVVKVRVDQ